MDSTLRLAIGILLLAVALYLLLAPGKVSTALARFYGRYPLVRLAPERQLQSAPTFVRALGAVVAVLGLAVFFL